MTQVIGIDLGTTNTVAAVVHEGHASTIPDETGQTLLPSVVSFHPNGSVLVGRAAKERRLVDAKNTIYSVKRLIGRSWETEEVRLARTRFAFEMREGPGQATLVVGRGETYTLPEISALVLRRAKEVAENSLGSTVDRAVITVPANFNDLQRAATKVAGRVAGLEVLRILNEPTAAALAYGFGKSSSEKLAVYDFGGGTFDVTLLDLSDNVFEVLATAGNTFLGGDDIDLALAERICDQFLQRHRYDPRSDPQSFERVRVAAEDIKQKLSFEQQATVEVEDLAHGAGGRPLNFTYRLSRSELEHLIRPIVEKTFDVCAEALSIARLEAQDFEQILVVGGSTRIPLVKKRVAEFFKRELKANISPDEVVALGAAIQANALSGAERRRAAVPAAPAAARRPAERAHQPAAPRPRAETLPGVAPAPAQPLFAAHPRSRESAVEEARRAREEASLLLPVIEPEQEEPTLARGSKSAAKPKEESVAFALGDNDIEDLTQAPAHSPAHLGDDEPTQAGGPRSSKFELEIPAAPAARERAAPPPAPSIVARAAAKTSSFGTLFDGLPPPGVSPGADPTGAEAHPMQVGTAPAGRAARPPLLVDVTPLTLVVETVQGYCDPIIVRNTPVPCEQTREFVTAANGQTVVRVRVAQGESKRFDENTVLGEVELLGLPPAARGAVQISVTFALDTNGMLDVSAKESASGRATTVQLHLMGLPETQDISAMALRHAQRQTA